MEGSKKVEHGWEERWGCRGISGEDGSGGRVYVMTELRLAR
jgi:hypothetical protein